VSKMMQSRTNAGVDMDVLWCCTATSSIVQFPLSPLRDLSQMPINCPFNLCSPAACSFG
jgi:hypothetical protein